MPLLESMGQTFLERDQDKVLWNTARPCVHSESADDDIWLYASLIIIINNPTNDTMMMMMIEVLIKCNY